MIIVIIIIMIIIIIIVVKILIITLLITAYKLKLFVNSLFNFRQITIIAFVFKDI